MKFNEYLESLDPLEEYAVEISVNDGESMVIEPVEGKLGSLRLLQNYLGEKESKDKPFDLSIFCEFYEEWKIDPKGHHSTINFLNKFNELGGFIRKMKKMN